MVFKSYLTLDEFPLCIIYIAGIYRIIGQLSRSFFCPFSEISCCLAIIIFKYYILGSLISALSILTSFPNHDAACKPIVFSKGVCVSIVTKIIFFSHHLCQTKASLLLTDAHNKQWSS